jgi:hypothetical protein
MYVSCLVLAGRCLSAQQRGRFILQLLWSSCCSRVTCHTSFGLYVCFWVVLVGVQSINQCYTCSYEAQKAHKAQNGVDSGWCWLVLILGCCMGDHSLTYLLAAQDIPRAAQAC